MNDDVHRGEGGGNALERGVEPLKKLKTHAPTGTVEGEVESRRADELA